MVIPALRRWASAVFVVQRRWRRRSKDMSVSPAPHGLKHVLTLLSAPLLVLKRVAVATLLLSGSTAPTATSGVSTTARSFGGIANRVLNGVGGAIDIAVEVMLSLDRLSLWRGRVDVLAASDFLVSGDDALAGDVAARDMLPGPIDFRRLGDGVWNVSVAEAGDGDDGSFDDCLCPKLESGHSRCMMTFLVAHYVTRFISGLSSPFFTITYSHLFALRGEPLQHVVGTHSNGCDAWVSCGKIIQLELRYHLLPSWQKSR